MSTDPFKLLLLWNNPNLAVFDGLLFPPPTVDGDFNGTAQSLTVAPRNGTKSTPDIEWDSANGEVLISRNGFDPSIGSNVQILSHLRSGQAITQDEVLSASQSSVMVTSMTICQNTPYYFMHQNQAGTVIRLTRFVRAADWNTSGVWKHYVPDASSFEVGNSFRFVSTARASNQMVYWSLVQDRKSGTGSRVQLNCNDPTTLQRSVLMPRIDTKGTLNAFDWHRYYLDSSIVFYGRPAMVVSGSTSTDRKLHVFLRTQALGQLYYFAVRLTENALPQAVPGSQDPTGVGLPLQTVDAGNVSGSNSAGPMSAIVWGQRVYIFYPKTGSNEIECYSKLVTDGGSWRKSAMSANSWVSGDSVWGGVAATLVQKSFSP